MVKIRLKKFGKKRQPYYRIVIQDARVNRDGKTIDEIGFYHPLNQNVDTYLRIDEEKARYWISKGAQATDTVRRLMNKRNITIK